MQGVKKKMSKPATESTLCKVNRILGISDSYEAPAKMMELLLGDSTNRRMIFHVFLEQFEYDLSYEWFYNYFQDEHADRKNNKQDFTPVCVSNLISEMLSCKPRDDSYTIIEEPAAGTGSTIIAHWHKSFRLCRFPWDYRPDDYLYRLTELSSKTVPFLLFNVMIRGMNAIVIHGNSLTKEIEAAYWIYNEENNPMGFSDIYIIPKERYDFITGDVQMKNENKRKKLTLNLDDLLDF